MMIHAGSHRTRMTKCGKPVARRLWFTLKQLREHPPIGRPNCPKCLTAMKRKQAPAGDGREGAR